MVWASGGRGRALILSGAALFLVGLAQGVVVQSFANPRMGLSAHLAAVQSGMALMLAGIVWPGAALPPLWDRACRAATAVGMWGVWFALTLAAATGAGEALPIAGAGFSGPAWAEPAVAAVVAASGAATLFGWAGLVAALIRAKAPA